MHAFKREVDVRNTHKSVRASLVIYNT